MFKPKLLILLICLAFVTHTYTQELPKVLFFSDPQRSDNDIVRRTSPDVPSIAERHFGEITKGIFEVVITQDPSAVTADSLKNYDAVIFFTAGNPPIDKAALVAWVQEGGAFVGIHSTSNTFQDFAPFGEMLGAYFESRPWRTKEKLLEKARFFVEDTAHPSTKHLSEAFEMTDDLYLYKNWDRSRVHVLLSMDPGSLDMTKVQHDNVDLAIAWTKSYGKGRVFYTMLGDSEPVWIDKRYQIHLIEGIKWTLQKEN